MPAKPALPTTVERGIIDAALAQGFVRAALAPVQRSERAAERLSAWLSAGRHGEMQYMQGGLDRAAPRQLFAAAKSVLVVALPYGEPLVSLRRTKHEPPIALVGRVARYARGEDYHRILKVKLERVGQAIDALAGRAVARRACVDSAPLLERDLAVRAGIGFAAKSTLTIVPGGGSFVLLGELLLDLDLDVEPTPAASTIGCGSCTKCLSACPTGAFAGPYELDARRCISYLTIELRGTIPRDLRALIGNHVFGCDICQDVCPYNRSRHAPPRDAELGRRPELDAPVLAEWLFLSSSGYRKLVGGTSLSRVSRARLSRNAAVALGNSRDPRAEAPLARALRAHSSALVREHAAWALGALRLPLGDGLEALRHARDRDEASEVRSEAERSLASYLAPEASLK